MSLETISVHIGAWSAFVSFILSFIPLTYTVVNKRRDKRERDTEKVESEQRFTSLEQVLDALLKEEKNHNREEL